MKNIVLSIEKKDQAFEKMKAALSEKADVNVTGLDGYSLEGVDIFIGKMLDGAKLAKADRLKAVFAYKTGVEDFPLEELKKRGILLCNSHVNSDIIAQYAFGLALTLVNRIADFDKKMRKGDWSAENPYWKSLFSMKAGILGFGGIGRAIGEILLRNEIPVYTLNRGKYYPQNICTANTLEELCKAVDILFIALPDTAQTENIIDADILAKLKGKYIVNVGRGNCIDERALYSCLKEGSLAGAAIDTWRSKPKNGEKPYFPFTEKFDKLDNIVLSSHKAMQVCDGHARYVEDVTANVQMYLDGKQPKNMIDLTLGY